MIPSYVNYCLSFISIKSVNVSLIKKLKKIGFRFNIFHTKCKKKINSEQELIALFQMLRDLDICFAIGKEWSPSEMFEFYREKGLISGKYNQISWIGKKKYLIKEK